MELCHVQYLSDALHCRATVTLRSQRLKNEEGTKDPKDEDERGAYTTAKDQNESYYTEPLGLTSY